MSSQALKVREARRPSAECMAADRGAWRMHARLEKFWAADLARAGLLGPHGELLGDPSGVAAPYEVCEQDFNLLMNGGASVLWECLIGNGTATAGAALTFFNNANAHIGVGNGTAAAADTQTDLQGASKTRKAMEATFPSHTDGTGDANDDISFRSVFGTADANHAWEEWGVFNGSTGGRMLNRKVESSGTKTSAAIWTLTVTMTLL